MGSWGMFFAPGKTPDAIVEKLNAAIRESLQAPAVAAIMQRDGYFPDNRNARDTAEFFRSEVRRMKEAVNAAKIEPI
jgi:tripartite-type tricarboxylate transporter receptor subunit TctC